MTAMRLPVCEMPVGTMHTASWGPDMCHLNLSVARFLNRYSVHLTWRLWSGQASVEVDCAS